MSITSIHRKLLLTACFFAGAVMTHAQNITNKGKEFWVGYGHHQYMERTCGSPTDNAPNDMNMVIYLSAEQAATVTITIDSSGDFPSISALWWRRTYNIPANTVISTENLPKGGVNSGPSGSDPNYDARLITDPTPAGTGGEGVFRGKGIRITSNVPIVAYAHIYGGVSSGATMLMPIDAWGYSYTSVNSEQRDAPRSYSFMYVVAKENNTRVVITPSALTRTNKPAGVPFTVDLQKGQIYQVIGSAVCATGDGPELTGTTVKSIAGPDGKCHPVAVFGGSSRTGGETMTCGTGSGRDNDMQQLFPESAWGKRYLTAPFSKATTTTLQANQFQTSVYKVVVKDPATVVTKNGVQLTGLINGKYYKYSSNTADYIIADKPVMVAQFMSGTGTCNGTGQGDPEMVCLSPIEQAIKRVGFYRNVREAINSNYITLIVPTAGVASLRIDGSGTFNHTYPHPNLPGYTVVVKGWIPSAQAQCLVTCDSAFNATTYGLGGAESYAYNAGTFINNLGALPSLHNELDPTLPEHPFTCVGSPVEISALIAYKPINLLWHLDSLASVVTPNAQVNMSNPIPMDSVLVNGVKYYKYKLPGTYQFSDTGTFYLPIMSTSPTVDNCNNTEELRIPIVVKPSPKPAFNFTHTGCTLDTVYLAGNNLAGTYTLAAWNWSFSTGGTATGKDTLALLPPGTHTITLTGISSEGCVGDSTRTITIHPKPTATFGITPPTVCFGQTITLTDTSSYAGTTPPINNWYWDLGNGNVLNNPNNNPVVVNYGAPNTYIIKHVVKVSPNCISDTAIKTVVISPEAQIAFTYPTTCLPPSGVAQFGAPLTDLGGVAVTSYSWNFGDPASGANNTSTAQNPSHTYSSFGTYPVTLSIMTSTGCGGDTTVNLTFGVQPALVYPALSPVCISAAPFSVGNASVTNAVAGTGTYSGPGITNAATGAFNPALAGAGTHTITYTYVTPACTETITQTITVNALPVVNAGTYAAVCINAANVTLNGTPAGGTFSGPAVTGTTFNPATAGAGTHTITYTYTDANGCMNAATSTITVNALPVVNAGTYAAVCINAANVTLNGTPAGGTFSGTGVTGTTFNPATAGAGTHTITYTYTNASGCTNSATTTITVNALPVVNAGTYAAACINAASVTLNGTPAGGTFSGIGVTGTTFNPATAGAGTHTLTYTYTNAGGCVNSATTTITVNALPVVNAGTYAARCINAAPVTLAGTPAGGTFSGPGVTGNTFTPATAGIGTHTITYNYTDANGCANAATTTITVYNLPVVNAGTYAAVCVDGAAVTLNGTPAGGTFSGPGVTGTTFNPATAGAGTHTITYSYTDPSGCSNAGTTTITVNALPVLNAGTYAPVCINGAAVTLSGTPAGGTFSGPGVTGTTFNPATAGAGTHTITYGGVGGCGNTITTTITVNPLPVVNAGTYSTVCVNAAAVTLAGTPAGGTFSGPGVTGTTFNPATAGAGTHTITYNYTGANGCANSATTTITVEALPVVNAGTYPAVCVNAAAVTLAGTPAGGTFSGTGVTGNSFSPATAGAGTHTITYSYTSANGCINTATTTITVNALPVVNAGNYGGVCLNGGAVTLAGTPAGGTFSGTGVTGNSFNPAVAGVGNHTITYNYTDVNGCSNSATTVIGVNVLPVVNAGTYSNVCVNGAAVTLAGTPAGGTFSGPGVTGNSFNPATAGAGTHTITYNYTGASGCANSATTTITVEALPLVNAGTYSPVCINAAAVTLAGTPAGGTFSGTGVTGNSFNPATAGVGTHTINYTYTSAAGCTNATTTTITVNPLPVVNAGTYAAVCLNSAAVTLAGTPAGGTFSGTGVTGNSFNPATAGAGTHTITYNYTDGNGCSNAATTTITVNALPVVNAGTYPAICVNGAAITLAGTPAGGIFSGPGVTGSSFNPATAGAGTHTITYNYTDANGCTNSGTTTITVNALPVVNAGTYSAVCNDASAITLAGTPTGGIFSGPGVTGNSFNPATAGVGTHTITYAYSDPAGCASSATTTIVVNAVPTAAAGFYPGICFEASPITLNGAPVGGTFSGPGVTGNSFNPSAAGAGIHTIVYAYTSPAGCTQTNSTTVEVFPRPTSSFTANNSICLDGTSLLTSTANISSGTITAWNWNLGDGNTPSYSNGNPFSVSYTNANAYTVQLVTVSDKGCVSAPATQTINVHPLPVANFDLPASICMPGGNAAFVNRTTVADNSALTYTWNFGDGNNSSVTNPTHVYGATGSYNVSLVATSAFGCVNQANKTLNSFFDKPIATFTVNPQELCQGADNNFRDGSTAPGSTIQKWNWNFNDGSSSTAANPVKKFNTPGSYNVSLVVTNAAGCVSDPYVVPVTVHLQPKIDAGQSFVVPMGTTIQFGATANSAGLNFSWSPPLGLSDPNALKPTLVANTDQTYILTATGSYGCTATDFLTVKILKPVVVPNIFTPNGDNIHDRWVIQNIADYPGATVEVFNRYGQQVFYSAGYATPWDGKYKGRDMPVGTYYYVIKLNNGFKMLNGSVTIVR